MGTEKVTLLSVRRHAGRKADFSAFVMGTTSSPMTITMHAGTVENISNVRPGQIIVIKDHDLQPDYAVVTAVDYDYNPNKWTLKRFGADHLAAHEHSLSMEGT